MREFLHGWRRKLGCVTLLVACVIFVGWMRSRVVWDVIIFERGDREHAVIAKDDGVLWLSWDLSEFDAPADIWQTYESSQFDAIRTEIPGIQDLNTLKESRVYWQSTLIGLTLAATYLILAKPCRTKCPSHEVEATDA